jgi:hypothetical protein
MKAVSWMSTSSLPKVGKASIKAVIMYYTFVTCVLKGMSYLLLESTASIGNKDNNEDEDGDDNNHHATKKRKGLDVYGNVFPSDVVVDHARGGMELSQLTQLSGISSSPARIDTATAALASTGNSLTRHIVRPPKKSKINNSSKKKKRPPISDSDLEKQVNEVRDISGGGNIVDSSLRNIVDLS